MNPPDVDPIYEGLGFATPTDGTELGMLANSTMRATDYPSIVLRNSLVCDLSGAIRNMTAAEILAGTVKST